MKYAILLFLLVGCQSIKHPEIDSAARGVAKIDAATSVITSTTDRMRKTDEISLIRQFTDIIREEASKIGKLLDDIQSNIQKIESTNQKLKKENEDLNDSWIGPKTWKWFWIISASWVVIGVASVFMGINPLSWLNSISRFFIQGLPFMNPFTWLRDWFRRKKN